MRRHRRSGAGAIESALRRAGAAQGLALAVDVARSEPWASATFVGRRHLLTISGTDDARLRGWLARLGETDLPLPGHLLAEIVVDRQSLDGAARTAAVTALVLED